VKIHHLNCGSFCPLGPVLDELTHCHCLLIETKTGLILLDTGLSKNHDNVVLKGYEKAAGVDYDKFLSAKESIEKLGFKPSDVRDILITHLDFDHSGGLLDFPNATLHIYNKELESANKAGPQIVRYQKALWKTHKNIVRYSDAGESWNGLKGIKTLSDIKEDIFLIPLIGHTLGHAGFAINHKNEEWLFHVGDAYYNHLEFTSSLKALPYKALARLNAMDNSNRVKNLKRIKQLQKVRNLEICNSHDPQDFNKFS